MKNVSSKVCEKRSLYPHVNQSIEDKNDFNGRLGEAAIIFLLSRYSSLVPFELVCLSLPFLPIIPQA